jgi:hypothetical protein
MKRQVQSLRDANKALCGIFQNKKKPGTVLDVRALTITTLLRVSIK